jgi:hypothetical protein
LRFGIVVVLLKDLLVNLIVLEIGGAVILQGLEILLDVEVVIFQIV